MRRHELDVVSLLVGLLFLGVGLLYLFDAEVDARWVLPFVLVGAGLAGIAGAVGRADRSGRGTGDSGDAGQGSSTTRVQ